MKNKTTVSPLQVHHKKPMKRNKNDSLFNKVLHYLNSDSYMFAPLLSSKPSDFSTTIAPGGEMEKPYKENNKKLLAKVEEYLKSDCFMYAPLVDPQPSFWSGSLGISSPKTVSGPAAAVTMGKTTVETVPLNKETKHVIGENKPSNSQPAASNAVIRKTVAYRETVKHMVQQSCRSSSLSGLLLETKARNLVVE